MEIPIENIRLKEVINYTSRGNISLFSKDIGISQPRIARLFIIDKRSKKYPLISFEIFQATINKFININIEWLCVGKGSMLKDAETTIKATEIEKKEARILSLEIQVNDLYNKYADVDCFMQAVRLKVEIEEEFKKIALSSSEKTHSKKH